MKRLPFAIVIALSMSWGTPSLAEDVTITTFYPSPFGDYDELTTKGKTTLAADSTANVGIGTTAPDAKLDIEVPNTGTQSLIFLSTPGERGGIAKLTYSTASPFPLTLDLNTNSFNIPRPLGIVGGKVGIGTTAPGAPLDIRVPIGDVQDILFASANQPPGDVFKLKLNAATSPFELFLDLANNETPPFNRPFGIINGNVGIGTRTPGAKLDIEVPNTGTQSLIFLSTPGERGGIAKLTYSTASPFPLILDLDTNSFNIPRPFGIVGGNVGIGTTNPSSSLTVQGQGTGFSDETFRINDSSGTSLITTVGDGRTYIGENTAQNASLVVTKASGDATGKILAFLQDNSQPGAPALRISGQSNEINMSISGTDGDISFGNSGANSRQLLLDTDTGNFGIGTSAPKSSLDIDGSLGLRIKIIGNSKEKLDDKSVENVILCNNTSDVEVELSKEDKQPNRTYYIKKVGDNTAKVTIKPKGNVLIDGKESIRLFNKGDAVRVISTGIEWFIIDKTEKKFERPDRPRDGFASCGFGACNVTATCPPGKKIVYADSNAWAVTNIFTGTTMGRCCGGNLIAAGCPDEQCMDLACRNDGGTAPTQPRIDCQGQTNCTENRGGSWPQCVRVWCE